MSDELRREAIRILEDMPPSASTAGQKILARGVLTLLDERDRLRAALQFVLLKVQAKTAGTLESPFAYLWTRDWMEFEKLARAAQKADSNDGGER